jgi:phosphatidylserine/phosphatidylglycerophosphate/cardiolipin synthase-like enzyme
MCYGRWDTQDHLLHNQPPINWEGADYCNFRIRDIYKPRDYMMTNLTSKEAKMPWHDIAIQIRGTSVHDVARHFVNYWNFVNFQTKIDDDRELLNLAGIRNPHYHPSRINAAKNFFKNLKFRKKTARVEPMLEMTGVVVNR